MSGPKKASEKESLESPANTDHVADEGGTTSSGNTTNEVKALTILPGPSAAPGLHYTHSRQRLTEEKLNVMSKAEIRAVALDRGYEMTGLGGRSGVIRHFLECQENEKGLHNPGNEVDEQGKAIVGLPQTTEFPAIDASRTDEDLTNEFVTEAKKLGYDDAAAKDIAAGRLHNLRNGGDGYTVEVATDTGDTVKAPAPRTPPTVQ